MWETCNTGCHLVVCLMLALISLLAEPVRRILFSWLQAYFGRGTPTEAVEVVDTSSLPWEGRLKHFSAASGGCRVENTLPWLRGPGPSNTRHTGVGTGRDAPFLSSTMNKQPGSATPWVHSSLWKPVTSRTVSGTSSEKKNRPPVQTPKARSPGPGAGDHSVSSRPPSHSQSRTVQKQNSKGSAKSSPKSLAVNSSPRGDSTPSKASLPRPAGCAVSVTSSVRVLLEPAQSTVTAQITAVQVLSHPRETLRQLVPRFKQSLRAAVLEKSPELLSTPATGRQCRCRLMRGETRQSAREARRERNRSQSSSKSCTSDKTGDEQKAPPICTPSSLPAISSAAADKAERSDITEKTAPCVTTAPASAAIFTYNMPKKEQEATITPSNFLFRVDQEAEKTPTPFEKLFGQMVPPKPMRAKDFVFKLDQDSQTASFTAERRTIAKDQLVSTNATSPTKASSAAPASTSTLTFKMPVEKQEVTAAPSNFLSKEERQGGDKEAEKTSAGSSVTKPKSNKNKNKKKTRTTKTSKNSLSSVANSTDQDSQTVSTTPESKTTACSKDQLFSTNATSPAPVNSAGESLPGKATPSPACSQNEEKVQRERHRPKLSLVKPFHFIPGVPKGYKLWN